MKNLAKILTLIVFATNLLMAQVALKDVNSNRDYIIFTHDGAQFAGKIIDYNKKSVTIKTIQLGEVELPTYQLMKIEEAKSNDIAKDGSYIADNALATRQFITTNGLDLKKGDGYVLVNWYGPDVQYGITDNISVGVMTTWFGTPVVGSLKYSTKIADKSHLALGVLGGTLGWTNLNTGGVLPYAALTYGDRKTNMTMSAGYGAIWVGDENAGASGNFLASFAGMARLNNSLSFVFDSMLIPGLNEDIALNALLVPGLRYQRKENFAIQMGLTGIYSDGFLPFTLPMFQIYWKFN